MFKLRPLSARREVVRNEERRPPVANIAIEITGGVGDLIVVARFWRDFMRGLESWTFDVFFSQVSIAAWIFKSIPGFRKAFHQDLFFEYQKKYGYTLTINQLLFIRKASPEIEDTEQLNLSHEVIHKRLKRIRETQGKISVIADHHPFLDGHLGRYAVFKDCTRQNFLHYLAGILYGGDVLPLDTSLSSKSFNLPSKYVTVHNGYDEAMGGGRDVIPTKVYPDWNAVINLLKENGCEYKFVQLGTPNTSLSLPAADLNLLGVTTLEEAAAIISGASLHLDNEGGLVHIAAALGVRSCVVFGPTDADFFGYSTNLNLKPAECGGCWWIEPSWMEKCPRGDSKPRCMRSHQPSAVASVITDILS